VLADTHEDRAEREDLATRAAGVLRGGVEEQADVAGVRPAMTRIAVVLPAPFGPRKPVTRPGLTSKETSSTAVNGP
jgi:hypothetical protein